MGTVVRQDGGWVMGVEDAELLPSEAETTENGLDAGAAGWLWWRKDDIA